MSTCVPCPACDDGITIDLAELIDSEGIYYPTGPSRLFHCKRCRLYFRYPLKNQLALLRLYQEQPGDRWTYAASRPDFALAMRLLGRLSAGQKVLDVGCFRGDLLMALPDTLQKFGIEPSVAARAIAAQRRITLLGSDVDSSALGPLQFDAILLLDVLEHLPRPMDALRHLRAHLADSGIMILSTGNTDALPWRLMRRRYWYYVTEHVCFFNPAWFAWSAGELRLALRVVTKFSHFPAPVVIRIWQLLKCLSYVSLLTLQQALPSGWQGGIRKAPATLHWRDHLFVVLSPNGKSLQ